MSTKLLSFIKHSILFTTYIDFYKEKIIINIMQMSFAVEKQNEAWIYDSIVKRILLVRIHIDLMKIHVNIIYILI